MFKVGDKVKAKTEYAEFNGTIVEIRQQTYYKYIVSVDDKVDFNLGFTEYELSLRPEEDNYKKVIL